MTSVLIVFLIAIFLLCILMGVAVKINHHSGENFDSQYLHFDCDHLYYDRGLIKKKQFRKNNPNSGELRTFRRLFKMTK